MESATPRTVPEILKAVYGSSAAAREALGLKSRSAPSNWASWGYFPERLEGRIVADAEKAGVALTFDDVAGLRKTAGKAA